MSYWHQTKSQLPKTGEGETHTLAREITQQVLTKAGYTVINDFPLEVKWSWGKPENRDGQTIKIERLLNSISSDKYYHEYDVIGIKCFENGLSEILIIEVGGGYDSSDNSKHSEFQKGKEHDRQMNRDRTAYQWARFLLPDMIFIRLDKDYVIKYQDNHSHIWSEIIAGKKINYSDKPKIDVDKELSDKHPGSGVIISDKSKLRNSVIKSDNAEGWPEL